MTDEEIAELIYNTWQDRPGFVPWVPNGNSIRQDEARRVADKALAARDALIAELAEVVSATTALRAAQRAYMLDRGNDALGRAVGEAAALVDEALAALETKHD